MGRDGCSSSHRSVSALGLGGACPSPTRRKWESDGAGRGARGWVAESWRVTVVRFTSRDWLSCECPPLRVESLVTMEAASFTRARHSASLRPLRSPARARGRRRHQTVYACAPANQTSRCGYPTCAGQTKKNNASQSQLVPKKKAEDSWPPLCTHDFIHVFTRSFVYKQTTVRNTKIKTELKFDGQEKKPKPA